MRTLAWVIAFALLCTGMTSCGAVGKVGNRISFQSQQPSSPKGKGHGPPPHAPAHGYRHKNHHGAELKFDAGLDVYVVIDVPSVYFFDDLYFRFAGDHWEVATHFRGNWRIAAGKEVPAKLKNSKGKSHPGKGRDRGKP